MLQPFGFFVNLFDRVIENLVEKGFDQPMMTQDLKSAALSFGSQSHSAVLFVFHVRLRSRSQLLQHIGHGCWRHVQSLSERSTRNGVLFWSAEGEDRLKVVVDRFSIVVHLTRNPTV